MRANPYIIESPGLIEYLYDRYQIPVEDRPGKGTEWQNDPRGDKTKNGKKGDWTFYQHQYLGEKLARDILSRLRCSQEVTRNVKLLVREHMFVYDPEVVTERGVRRLIRRVGEENIDDLIKVRVGGNEVDNGKPAPDIYTLAAERLGIPSSDCVAIEDSCNGVKSAHGAGMICLGFRNPDSGQQDLLAADLLFDAFSELSVEKLQGL